MLLSCQFADFPVNGAVFNNVGVNNGPTNAPNNTSRDVGQGDIVKLQQQLQVGSSFLLRAIAFDVCAEFRTFLFGPPCV